MVFYIPNEWFILILLFVLIFLLSFFVLRKFFKEEKISKIIAILISLLSIYFLKSEQYDFISNIYTVWGVIILMLIPFLIAFFFLYSSNISNIFRKTFWFFFFGLNFFIVQRLDINPEISKNISIGIIIFGIIILIFDKTIKNKINVFKNLKRF